MPGPAPVVVQMSATGWKPVPDVLTHAYTIEQRARIASTVGSASTVDSAVLLVEASLRRTPAGGAAGLVESIRITAPGSPSHVPDGLLLPLAIAAPPVPRGQAFAFGPAFSSTGVRCPSPIPSVLNALRDVVLRAPDSLYVGATWSDSASFRTCAGDHELPMIATRTYVVAGHVPAGGSDSVPDDHVVIQRATKLFVASTLTRNDDTTRVSGGGNGILTLLVSTTTGDVLAGSGAASLDFSVRSALREETAHQAVAIRLRRLR